MAKKIKFPLKMADGSQARNIEELREHFDLTMILGYYASGRLIEWLTDRYYDDEAEKIKALEPSSKEFKKNLCEILAVPYSENEAGDVDLAEIAAKNERYERLKQFTADDTILAAVDLVAFTQEDLADLLDKDAKLIYLCGERFRIPCSKGGVTYIGVNNPVVDIPGYYNKKEILFKGVQGKNIPDDSTKNVFPSDSDSCSNSPDKTVQKAAEASGKIASEAEDRSPDTDLTKLDNIFNLMFEIASDHTFLDKISLHAPDSFKDLPSETSSTFRLIVRFVSESDGIGSVGGVIDKGSIQINDEVTITKADGTWFKSIVLGIECPDDPFGLGINKAESSLDMGMWMFVSRIDYAKEGDRVMLCIKDTKMKDFSVGDVVLKA